MKAEEYNLDFTVTLTAEDAKFTDEAVAAGVPLIVVTMFRDALRKLVAAEREACKELMLKAMRVLEEAQTYTSCQAWSPSMTEECKQMEEALRNYMYDKLAEKHADNMKKDIKVMTDWVKKETEAIRARGQV